MDKSQQLLETEIAQLRSKIEAEPEKVFATAEQCVARANQILYPDGVIQGLIIMSRCLFTIVSRQNPRAASFSISVFRISANFAVGLLK